MDEMRDLRLTSNKSLRCIISACFFDVNYHMYPSQTTISFTENVLHSCAEFVVMGSTEISRNHNIHSKFKLKIVPFAHTMSFCRLTVCIYACLFNLQMQRSLKICIKNVVFNLFFSSRR